VFPNKVKVTTNLITSKITKNYRYMRKIIFTAITVFMSFINAQTQTPMFSIRANQIPITVTKQNEDWILINGKLRTEITGKGESNYLEVKIPRQNPIPEDTAFYQRVILNIKHNLELTKDVQAIIEVKCYGNQKWTSFVPINKEFIDILAMKQKASKKIISMYPNGIFKSPIQKPQNYDKLYSLHVAGGDAKIKLIDVSKIEKFRFKLKNNSVNDKSLWEFDLMLMDYVKTSKPKPNMKKARPATPQKKYRIGENLSDTYQMEKEFDNGGTCPKPHGH
jgi:hypothetical protein